MRANAGENWFVKLPNRIELDRVSVQDLTAKTAVLCWQAAFMGGLPYCARYKIEDVDFVEMVSCEPKKSPNEGG